MNIVKKNTEAIEKDARAIMEAAHHGFQAIMARRDAMDDAGLADKPLFVMAGEYHSMPSHILYHLLIINKLVAQEPRLSLGFEVPHNTASEGFGRFFDMPLPTAQAQQIDMQDHNGLHALQTEFAFVNPGYSRYASKLLNKTALDLVEAGALSAIFADAAWADGNADLNEQKTLHLSGLENNSTIVPLTSPSGIYIRNKIMIRQLQDKAKAQQARIVYLAAGLLHLYGAAGYPHEQSLAVLAKQADMDILTMPFLNGQIESDGILQILAEIDFNDAQGIGPKEIAFVTGLPEVTAVYDDQDIPLSPDIIKDEHVEAAYVNALLAALGLDDYISSPELLDKQADAVLDELNKRWAKEIPGITL